MSAPRKGSSPRKTKNQHVTRSGKVIKVNRSLTGRLAARKDERAKRKALRLAGLPKGRIKRFLYHFHPKRMYKYWFSRDGAIMAAKLAGIGVAVGFLILLGLFAYFRKDLPNLKDVSGNNIGGSIRYYDRTGSTLLWEDYDAVKRIPVQDSDISQYVKDATVAVEDKDFFKHGGFDVRGILRAGINDVVGGGSKQGGSTITQQLVKLTNNWTADQTYTRKVKELILAVELERSYSKQEILTGYLNTAPYGGIEYGVEAGSRDYFNKSAKDLTLPEAAMLATIPKSPRYYSPYSGDFDKEAFTGRKDYVLDIMEQTGKITKQQRDDAKKVDVVATVKPRKPKFDGIKAPWFSLAAKKQLEDKYGAENVQRSGWKVITTLDMDKQKLAEDQVAKGLAQIKRQGGDTAAFAAEDVTTGQMVALVGGTDFSNPDYGQINYAQTALPPGSSFKPYDYASLIENTNTAGAGSVIYDTQGAIDGYPCTNKAVPKQGGNCLWDYDLKYPGPVSIRYALGGSRNVPAVKAMLIAGVDKTIGVAERLGLKSGYNCYLDEKLTKEGPCYASAAIGDGAYLHLDEHVHGYASLSRNGLNIPQTYILKISDGQNKVVDEWKPSKGEQAIRADAAYIIDDMISDPNASYFPSARKPHRYKGWKFAMKTGTTNDGKDGWMMGFSTKYAAGVWVGYHSRQKVMSGSMEDMTQPIWQGWMNKAHDGLTPVERVKPSTVQTLPAYVVRNHVGIGSIEPSPSTDLFPSWYQQKNKTDSGPKTIDQVSNKLASDCTPELAKKTVTDAGADSFSVDRFVGTGGISGGTTGDKDDVHKCDDARPSITLTQNGSSSFTATVSAGTFPLSSDKFKGTINFLVDGQVVQSSNVSDSPSSVSYNYAGAASGTLTAQIIDSVLYDAKSSESYSVSSGSSVGVTVLTPTSGQSTGGNTTVTWSGGTGSYTVVLDGSSLCSNTNGFSCPVTVSGANGSNHTVYIKQSDGTVSPTISFKK